MRLPQINASLSSDIHSILIPCFKGEDATDKLAALELSESETASVKEYFKGDNTDLFPVVSDQRILIFLGLGDSKTYTAVNKVFRSFGANCKHYLKENTGIYLSHVSGNTRQMVAEAVVNGLVVSAYEIGKFKSERADAHPILADDFRLHLIADQNGSELEQAVKSGYESAQVQMRIADLVNAPANKKAPEVLAKWAFESAEKFGYQAQILGKTEIERLGLHALLGVNRGSEHPPRFIVLKYGMSEGKQPTFGLAGKGVTFDTGGLSLKQPTNMHYMKSDMGGAAAVLGTVELLARLKAKTSVVAVIPATENSVDSLSVKPGDVIDSYSGKTIEIIDTDAEGRLILADALSYLVKNFNPAYLLDVATLTGSAVRTFGYECAALMSNNDRLAEDLIQASDQTEERIWRLPLYDEYAEEMNSDVADIKNLSTKPMAGAITAGKFLQFFTDEHPKWAHLDIAGVAFNDRGFAKGKSATAFGARLLTQWILNQSNS